MMKYYLLILSIIAGATICSTRPNLYDALMKSFAHEKMFIDQTGWACPNGGDWHRFYYANSNGTKTMHFDICSGNGKIKNAEVDFGSLPEVSTSVAHYMSYNRNGSVIWYISLTKNHKKCRLEPQSNMVDFKVACNWTGADPGGSDWHTFYPKGTDHAISGTFAFTSGTNSTDIGSYSIDLTGHKMQNVWRKYLFWVDGTDHQFIAILELEPKYCLKTSNNKKFTLWHNEVVHAERECTFSRKYQTQANLKFRRDKDDDECKVSFPSQVKLRTSTNADGNAVMTNFRWDYD